ncbi:ankyrin repeat-containing domain protein [Aspergillus floccosus]
MRTRALVTAVQNHDLATVRHLLSRNVPPDQPYHSDPPLIEAIVHKHLDIIQLYKYNVRGYMGEHNETEIHVAARVGNLPILEFLWKQLKSRNEHDFLHRADVDGMTPLHSAAASGSVECVRFLFHEGADVNSCTTLGLTPLHYAAEKYNARETVEALMNAGANLTARSITSSTILHRAAEAGRIEMMQWILQHTSLPADEANSYGWTPLHFAVSKNHLIAVNFLVEHGADISAIMLIPKSASALQLAAYFSGDDVKVSVADESALMSYLLARGADISERADDSLSIGGFAPVHRDVLRLVGTHEVGESMLEEFYAQASDTARDDKDRITPLDCAAEIGSIPKVQLLLATGAIYQCTESRERLNGAAPCGRTGPGDAFLIPQWSGHTD